MKLPLVHGRMTQRAACCCCALSGSYRRSRKRREAQEFPLLGRGSPGASARAWPITVMASSEDDPSQWTRIVRKGKDKKLGRKGEVLSLPVGGPSENFRPNGSPQLTLDDIKADHHKIASKWRTTKCYEQLRSIVVEKVVSHQKVTRAVCLGIGAFDPEDGSWTSQRRSHIQLAAFLAIVDALSWFSPI